MDLDESNVCFHHKFPFFILFKIPISSIGRLFFFYIKDLPTELLANSKMFHLFRYLWLIFDMGIGISSVEMLNGFFYHSKENNALVVPAIRIDMCSKKKKPVCFNDEMKKKESFMWTKGLCFDSNQISCRHRRIQPKQTSIEYGSDRLAFELRCVYVNWYRHVHRLRQNLKKKTKINHI